jgi:hypothetical protein
MPDGFSRNKGLAMIDANSMKLIREVNLFGDDSEWNEIRSIEMYHPDTLWIGTNASLLWFDTKSGSMAGYWMRKNIHGLPVLQL